MAYATTLEFLARVDARYVTDLTTAAADGTPDEARIERALDDATGELDGWLLRVAAGRVPGAGTLRVHCVKIALYLLTLDRPGKEYEQIRNAYTDVVAFYTGLVADTVAGNATPPVEGSACAPDPVFTPGAMKGFV